MTILDKLDLAQQLIEEECDVIKHLLLAKNKSYGNSAIDPLRCFSSASPEEQINVRIDDKLSRLMQGGEYNEEDTEEDLIGYLILKRVCQRFQKTVIDT